MVPPGVSATMSHYKPLQNPLVTSHMESTSVHPDEVCWMDPTCDVTRGPENVGNGSLSR